MTFKRKTKKGGYTRQVSPSVEISVGVNNNRLEIITFKRLQLSLREMLEFAGFFVLLAGLPAFLVLAMVISIQENSRVINTFRIEYVYLMIALFVIGLMWAWMRKKIHDYQRVLIHSSGRIINSNYSGKISGVRVVSQGASFEVHLASENNAPYPLFHSLTRERAEEIAHYIDEYLHLNTPYDDLFMIEQDDAYKVTDNAKEKDEQRHL